MKYPISEVIDRLSIVHLKIMFMGGKTFDDEFNALSKAMEDFERFNGVHLETDLVELITVNRKIWDLEADIRQGKEGLLGLEEVGRRAMAIRDLNGKRVALKNKISEKVGGFKEVKKNHASE